MNRLRKFTIFNHSSLQQSDEILVGLTNEASSKGWHRTWSTAVARVDANNDVIAFPSNNRQTPVLVISKLNLESVSPVGLWSSSPIKCAGEQYWASRNIKDFQWSFVDGSDLEVPFQFTTLQRITHKTRNALLQLRRKLDNIAFSKQPTEDD